jgi:hypothetical protein
MNINEHEKLSNLTLKQKLKERNSAFMAVLHKGCVNNYYSRKLVLIYASGLCLEKPICAKLFISISINFRGLRKI